MTRTVLILNGPNLNMLGWRDPKIYGSQTLADIKSLCETAARAHGFALDFRQSNHEGELVTWIQDALDKVAGIVINPAAYTHTSVALRDALELHTVPVIEVHLSDPEAREPFRHRSFIADLAAVRIRGQGAQGYVKALEELAKIVN